MITLQELNALLPTIYLTKQLTEIDWVNVSDTDKQALITQAEAFMNNLRFTGKYAVDGQDSEFPRLIYDTTYRTWVTVEVNDNIKKALCCLAFDLLYNTTSQNKQLQRDGVKSINTAGVTVSYTEDVVEVSDKYKQFIGRYLFKGVL